MCDECRTPFYNLCQQRISLDSLFDLLRLHTNVPLRGGDTAVVQKPLHQGNIIAATLVDLCGETDIGLGGIQNYFLSAFWQLRRSQPLFFVF